MTVYAYSDGSAIGNPGPGGYGVVLTYQNARKELTEGFRRTTNNRMELLGAIVALEALRRPSKVILFTDSKYVVDGFSEGWAAKWRSNGWRRGNRGRALNPDLWARLLDVVAKHDATFKWIRGHSGHPENERCDQMANSAAKGQNLSIDREYESTHPTPGGRTLA